MQTPLITEVTNYLRAGTLAQGTKAEYQTTLNKWKEWGNGVPLETLGRREIREFLDWVHSQAIAEEGLNPGRTANKARPSACHHCVGLGPGFDRLVAALSESQGTAGHCRSPLPDQGGVECSLLRYLPDEAPQRLGSRIRSDAIGDALWSCFSIMAWIPEPFGNRHHTTSQFFGGTSVGTSSRLIGTSSSSRAGAGSSTSESRQARRSIGP